MSTPGYGKDGKDGFESQESDAGASSDLPFAQSYPSYGGAGVPENYPTGYAGQPVEKNGVSVAALVIGIIAIVLTVTIVGFMPGIVVAIAGIVVSIIALVRAKRFAPGGQRRGMAIAGLILSVLSLLVSALLLVFVFFVFSGTGVLDCSSLQDEAAIERCVEEALTNG